MQRTMSFIFIFILLCSYAEMADLIGVEDTMVVGDIMEDTKDQEDILTGMMMKGRISAQELKEECWTVE